MLSKRQYIILNSCADDLELFYFPFAFVNYGGGVHRRFDLALRAARRLLGRDISIDPSRYEDQGPWSVSVSGLEIAWDIRILFVSGLLKAQRVGPGPDYEREPVGSAGLSNEELLIYRDYHCLTFDDHTDAFDYGPHEFKITEAGLAEVERPEYREYDRELGWPKGSR
jgi:hypothetical protein